MNWLLRGPDAADGMPHTRRWVSVVVLMVGLAAFGLTIAGILTGRLA